MKYVKFLLLAGVLPLAAMPGDANANAYYTRQYYSDWHSYGNCYYRDYYYKPSVDYCGYKHHYVMFYPSHPNYYYFFNPYKQAFWGRCPCECHGQEQYSLLPEQFRKPDLAQIPETAFPPMTQMPPVPDSKDGEKLDLPPDDPPNGTQGLPATVNASIGPPAAGGTVQNPQQNQQNQQQNPPLPQQ
jgi:hypothetical protein